MKSLQELITEVALNKKEVLGKVARINKSSLPKSVLVAYDAMYPTSRISTFDAKKSFPYKEGEIHLKQACNKLQNDGLFMITVNTDIVLYTVEDAKVRGGIINLFDKTGKLLKTIPNNKVSIEAQTYIQNYVKQNNIKEYFLAVY